MHTKLYCILSSVGRPFVMASYAKYEISRSEEPLGIYHACRRYLKPQLWSKYALNFWPLRDAELPERPRYQIECKWKTEKQASGNPVSITFHIQRLCVMYEFWVSRHIK